MAGRKNKHEDEMKPLILFTLLCSVLFGCGRKMVYDDPFSNCEAQIQACLTNDVVGYSRTIHIYPRRADPDPRNWTADVEVEYINHNGGIDRTNIPYKCYQTNHWAEDASKLYERAMAAH